MSSIASWGRAVIAGAAMLFGASSAHIAAADTITVTHWGSAFYGAPYAVAMAKGYFKAHGVDVTGVLTSTGGGTSVRNTLAGDLPYGEVSLAAAIEAINAGQPLKIVCAGSESVADILWVAKPDSPMTSIKDIVGKKIGYTAPGSVTNMLILMAMKAQGIDPSTVTLVPAGGIGANLAAVLSGAVDAGMTAEPVWSQEKSKVKPVFWTKDVMSPEMTQTVGIVTEEFAKAHPEKIRAIIEGRREGVAFITAHPNEAADITAKAYNSDAALARQVFKHFVEIHYWGDGALNYAA
ncbi:MAG TPA: ABC transporter substrate-binding protein, partial [Stellaceae bacterium]|nr:ABC transporter substrate-binding protein [Stellaceae bacterium]